MGIDREIPYCTIILVVGALTCHTLVLQGNLATSAAMADLGKSTDGWSNVGLGLAESLNSELDALLSNTTEQLTKTIKTIMAVQQITDLVLSAAGDSADAALEQAGAEGKETKAGKEAAAASLSEEASRRDEKVITLINDCYGAKIVSNPSELSKIRSEKDHESKMWVCIDSRPMLGLLGMGDALTFNMNSQEIGDAIHSHTQTIVKYRQGEDPDEFQKQLKRVIKKTVDELMKFVTAKLDEFLVEITPALEQIGQWLITFSDKIQAVIESFSTTLDRVQKLFDELMAKFSPDAGKGAEQMIYDTITLFDTTNSGTVQASDLNAIATMYGVSSLQGDKADTLFQKYDRDESGDLDPDEYALLVEDDSVPGVMAVVLRAFSKKLSAISGNIAAARMRDEVAETVSQYLTLICAKNKTKVEWVSDRLTNGSIPMSFSADLLKRLAENMDNPDKLTDADVGAIVTSEMVRLNKSYVQETVALLSDPEFWLSEGFDPDLQPDIVEQVVKWLAGADCVLTDSKNECSKAGCRWDGEACQVIADGSSLLEWTSSLKERHAVEVTAEGASVLQTEEADGLHESQQAAARRAAQVRFLLPGLARKGVAKKAALHQREQRRQRAAKQATLYQSVSSRRLRTNLLAGSAASSGSGKDPAQEMALNSGVPAAPATLEFAKFLSWNASQTSDRFQGQCFDYTGQSSSSLDSFADAIQAMIKKIQTFLNLMDEYSTPEGIQRLEDMVRDFAAKGGEEVVRILDDQVDNFDLGAHGVDLENFNATIKALGSFSQGHLPGASTSLLAIDEQRDDTTDIFEQVNTLLTGLLTALPSVLDNLKNARKQVSVASSGMLSIFGVFKESGPPIFVQVSALYATLWTTYFTFFAILTVGILFYGFWASGWCGPTSGADVYEEYVPPATMKEKLMAVCGTCGSCMRGCHDSAMCFWSFIILFQVIVLILFVVSIVLCLLSGVKAFMSAGCAQIYFLNDPSVCQGVLDMVKTFLSSFWNSNESKLENACGAETLVTCEIIGKKLQSSVTSTVVGSLLASVLSFQMIIDSAVLHERARWRKIFDEKDATPK